MAQLIQLADEAAGILSRFKRDRDGVHIAEGDAARFTGLVLEARDVLSESLGVANSFGTQLELARIEGISNFFHSQSYHSVEQAVGILRAAASTVKRRTASDTTKRVEDGPSGRQPPALHPALRDTGSSETDGSSLVGKLRNLGKPVRLKGVKLAGFAAEAAPAGTDQIKVITSLQTTSDDPLFHLIAKHLGNLISGHANEVGHSIDITRHSMVLLVAHSDDEADLYADRAAVTVEMMAKRPVQAGQPIFETDIADIRSMGFPDVQFAPDDRVICLVRVGWKFGLFFDVARERQFDQKSMERALGRVYRSLTYQLLYEAIGDETLLGELIATGWFPFIEIIGRDFEPILAAVRHHFDRQADEEALIAKFDKQRLDRIAERWNSHRLLRSRTAVLRSGLKSFEQGDAVACIKTLLTEIEGILQDAHREEHGRGTSIDRLSKYVGTKGAERAGGSDSLLFPERFQRYLSEYVYAEFDPRGSKASYASRHSVGHGAANDDAYTMPHALQAVLTIDQLAFYL